MRLWREASERRAITNGHNARVTNRRTGRALSAVAAPVLSSDQRVISIDVDHLAGMSDLAEDAVLN